MSSVIISPEFEELKNETEKLRTELSMLMLERDELCVVECKNIEITYMLKLGLLSIKFLKHNALFAIKARCQTDTSKEKPSIVIFQ